ncbi:MAG TPA: hypothetical protein VMZ53_19050 [Kofleriaceae bacterium]|nr:hypothetical protein [Kofleriaceae bacterium]
MSEKPVPDVEQAFDSDKHLELAKAIEKLNPEEAAYFLWKLEIAIRKRKIQIMGYLVAMLVWLGGMLFALVYYGTHDGFVGWAFLLPFVLVGAILFSFGKWSDRIGKSKPPENVSVPVDKKR